MPKYIILADGMEALSLDGEQKYNTDSLDEALRALLGIRKLYPNNVYELYSLEEKWKGGLTI